MNKSRSAELFKKHSDADLKRIEWLVASPVTGRGNVTVKDELFPLDCA